MKELRIDFAPTFHQHVFIKFDIDGDYGLLSLAATDFETINEISIEEINNLQLIIAETQPMNLKSIEDRLGRDGILINCLYRDQDGVTCFTVTNPTGPEYLLHQKLIIGAYQIACRMMMDSRSVKLLKDLYSYLDR